MCGQTWPRKEIIVVEDGSSDRSKIDSLRMPSINAVHGRNQFAKMDAMRLFESFFSQSMVRIRILPVVG